MSTLESSANRLEAGDIAGGLVVLAGAGSLVILGAAVGVPQALATFGGDFGAGLDGIVDVGIAVVALAAGALGLGILFRLEAARQLFIPAGLGFALFTAFVFIMTGLSSQWGLLTLYFAAMTGLMWSSFGSEFVAGGWPTQKISLPVAGAVALVAVVLGFQAKGRHDGEQAARQARRMFDHRLSEARGRVIEAAELAYVAGSEATDLGPGQPDSQGAVKGDAAARQKASLDQAREGLRLLSGLEGEFVSLRAGAPELWQASRELTLRTLDAVAGRISAGRAAPDRLRGAVERARVVQAALRGGVKPSDQAYLRDALQWADKVLQRLR